MYDKPYIDTYTDTCNTQRLSYRMIKIDEILYYDTPLISASSRHIRTINLINTCATLTSVEFRGLRSRYSGALLKFNVPPLNITGAPVPLYYTAVPVNLAVHW